MSTKYVPEVMTEATRDAIVDPLTALMICNSDTNKINYFNGTVWVEIGGGSGGMWSLVESQTLSDDAQIDFVLPDSTSWYRFVFSRIFLDSNNRRLLANVSIDGGISFITTLTYNWTLHYSEASAAAANASETDGEIWFTNSKLRNSPNPTSGIVDYWSNGGGKRCLFHSRFAVDNSVARAHYSGTGSNSTTTAIDAIRFFPHAGNFATGKILLYKNNDIVL